MQIFWYYKFTKLIAEVSNIYVTVSDSASLKADIGEKIKQTNSLENLNTIEDKNNLCCFQVGDLVNNFPIITLK